MKTKIHDYKDKRNNPFRIHHSKYAIVFKNDNIKKFLLPFFKTAISTIRNSNKNYESGRFVIDFLTNAKIATLFFIKFFNQIEFFLKKFVSNTLKSKFNRTHKQAEYELVDFFFISKKSEWGLELDKYWLSKDLWGKWDNKCRKHLLFFKEINGNTLYFQWTEGLSLRVTIHPSLFPIFDESHTKIDNIFKDIFGK